MAWRVVEDNRQIVVGSGSRHDDGFIWRYFIEGRGQDGSVEIEAELDSVTSFPWQSGSGYRREPLRIETMSANDIAKDCLCIFKGNGVYEGARCPKLP